MKRILDVITGFFRRLMEKDLAVKIISLVSAIIIWFIISVNEYPTISKVFYNVPIVIDMTDTYAEAHNFSVVSKYETEATVYITGERGQIGDMTKSDLTIVASAENVVTAKEYDLPIEVVCSSGKNFTVTRISTNSQYSTDSINVTFDEIIKKSVSVKPLMNGIHIAQGYISDDDDAVIVPSTIEITGPKDAVNAIDTAYIPINVSDELSSTFDYSTTEVKLYSGNSPASKTEDITYGKTTFNVHIPILKKQTLPLEVQIINAPESFDTKSFAEKLTISVKELEIAAPAESIRNIDSLSIGSIDMREVDIGSEFTFYTADFLPEGYQNLSGNSYVTVTCPSEGLYKTHIRVDQNAIQIINAPAQFDYRIITSGFTLIFIGSEESLRQLSYMDIISQIDLINYDLEERDYKFPVTFSTPLYDDVWCIGSDGDLSPKATVTVSLKTMD